MSPYIKDKMKFLTYTGKRIDLTNVQPDDIDIEDIAHSLSLQCRFGGHTVEFYSVAEHCLHVANLLKSQGFDEKIIFIGLMHDAAEAYVCDIPRPIKLEFPMFEYFEDDILKLIFKKYNIMEQEAIISADDSLPQEVKKADNKMLRYEIDCFMQRSVTETPEPGENPIKNCLTPFQAKDAFLIRFKELCNV